MCVCLSGIWSKAWCDNQFLTSYAYFPLVGKVIKYVKRGIVVTFKRPMAFGDRGGSYTTL